MILAIRANNYLVYSNEVELSMRANMKIKRMVSNTIPIGNIHVLKAAGIYGPNNVGKTCLIRAIESIKNVLLNFAAEVPVNLYTDDSTCYLGITFTDENSIYSYDFKFDTSSLNGIVPGFIYEEFSEIKTDKYGNEKKHLLFLKDTVTQTYKFPNNRNIEELMRSIATNNILIYTINTEKYELLGKFEDILRRCAESIEIVDLGNIPMEKTIQLLKDENADKSKVVELIKNADIDAADYLYVKPDVINIPIQPTGQKMPHEVVLRAQTLVNDMFCLMSDHRGKKVPSLIYDSTGTKKFAALASYIVEALQEGKTLVVDELNSSLHFKLTRAIAALFNNELNKKAQMIFTVHDVTLLDCKKLFRKDQIWFAEKADKVYLYSLDNFTAEDGVRAESSNIAEQYKKGVLGAIPDPDLISVLTGDN